MRLRNEIFIFYNKLLKTKINYYNRCNSNCLFFYRSGFFCINNRYIMGDCNKKNNFLYFIKLYEQIKE